MPRYIVTYDLHEPGQNYDALKKLIQTYPSYRWLMESTWGIVSTASAKEIRDYLDDALDSNDKRLVGPLPSPCAWQGLPKKTAAWLKENA